MRCFKDKLSPGVAKRFQMVKKIKKTKNNEKMMKNTVENIGELLKRISPWLVYMILSGLIFYHTYYKYKYCPQYYYLHQMLGESLGWSRGAAAVLWVSSSAVLLPMCRNLITFLRLWLYKFPIKSIKRLLDQNVWFHKACAFITIVFSAIHTTAHLINGEHFSKYYSDEYPELNFASYKNQDPLVFVLFSVAGATGILMMLILIVLISTSMNSVRSSSYEVFWYIHHLFVVFYLLLAVHGLGGVVKHQINLDKHTPGCTRHHRINMTNKNTSQLCTEPAIFHADKAQAWKFLIVPICLYLLDRMVRLVRMHQEVEIVKVVKHSCDVVELQLKQNRFKARPGQFVFIRCCDVAQFEWHPFTLTKCPSQSGDAFSIHFKIIGNWTMKFAKMLSACKASERFPLLVSTDNTETCTVSIPSQIRINVDGPYGSPSMDVGLYEVSLCIASGIGATPFAAVINNLRFQQLNNKSRLRRLYVVWVCRDVRSFGWFVDTLHNKHQQLWEKNEPDFLVCRFYATRQSMHDFDKSCTSQTSLTSSWFHSRLTQARPDWPCIFRKVAQENPRTTIGVFYCGAKSLSSKLRHHCMKFYKTRSSFVFHQETLS